MRQVGRCLLLFAAVSLDLPAQEPTPALKATTTGVVVDVSVLDAKGQPVLDLTPEDFELSEDGKRQQLVSVTLVRAGVARAQSAPASAVSVTASGAVPSPPATTATAAAVAPANDITPSVTAILFDRLSPEMRAVAGQAALAYVATLSPPHDYAGVFLADTTFRTFQTFTNQRDSLQQGVSRVASTAPVNLAAGAERAATTRVQGFDPNQPQTAGAESGQGFSAADRQALMNKPPTPDALLLRLELKMGEGYQRFASEYEGQASLTGLRATVDALAALPGRKSVLYFTENLQVTSRLKAKFDELIGRANRANITVYPVDAAGLRVHSEEAKLGRNVGVAGSQGIGDERRGDGAWTRDLERQDEMLSSRPGAVLGHLAKETGGFPLENTNNLAAGVARMQQERTTYYLLTYQPVKAMDGKFRRVNVKVKRPKVTVRARPGYLALAAGIQ
jgi:VWFA-related protein